MKKFKALRKAIDTVLKIIYPNRCMGCSVLLNANSDSPLCAQCIKDFEEYKGNRCEKCGRIMEHKGKCIDCNSQKRYFDKGYCMAEYKGSLRNAILSFKYGNKLRYADYLGFVLLSYASREISAKYDYITAVPLHSKRLRQRGYNQSELITKAIAEGLDITYSNILVRQKETKPQNSLNKKQRYENIKGAFEMAKGQNIENKSILIIDDIYTTGATINECCKVLKKNKAKIVDFLVLSCRADE